MLTRLKTLAVLGSAVLGVTVSASADSVFIQFIQPYTSNIVPGADGGGPPYMTALFEDIVAQPGKVRLTLSTFGLTSPNEFVSKWYFNLNPTMDVSNLSFSLDAGATTAVTSPNYSFVKDENDLDLGGQAVGFDFGTEFGTRNRAEKRFAADELFIGTISSSQSGLNANSFKFLNAGDGNNDIFFYGIAHVQGIAGGLSTKLGGEIIQPSPVTILPLPTAALAGCVLVSAVGLYRLRQRMMSE